MASATDAGTRTVRRSVRFVAWVRAWRAGMIPYDDVADEIEATEDHLMADAADHAGEIPLRDGLAALSPLHPDEIRLVLPAPGDPRGLPGPATRFTGAALAAEEGVLTSKVGLVPELRAHTSGSGDTFSTVVWRRYPLSDAPGPAPAPAPDPTPAQAEAELTAALAEATTVLTNLDIAQWRPELAGALAALRRHDDSGELPPVFNPRARRLYSRASLLDRMLALANYVAPGGAVDTYEAQQRDAALRPLLTACRQAVMVACNASLEP